MTLLPIYRSIVRIRCWSQPFTDGGRKRPIPSFTTVRSFSDNVDSTSIQMFDSLSERLQPLPLYATSSGKQQGDEKKGLAWYTCGPTTYAPAHLGHARTYVWIDIIRRVMEATMVGVGANLVPPPLFVMNITDVDDKILAAATEQQVSPLTLARKFEAEFWKDLEALNCLRPHVVTRVSEHVTSHIVPFIERLVSQGMAYLAEDGVYFHVKAYNEQLGAVTKYGKLAPPSASEDLEITRRNPPVGALSSSALSTKKDPRDFVLWKSKKPQEGLSWPSPWGEGRPGWHIECSAMIEAVQTQFGATHQFRVHAGGVDLKFPHHTNEIAQSEAYRQTGHWIPHWIHTGHLHIDGMKMSKSQKNFITIQDYLEGETNNATTLSVMDSPSDDFRLWCLGLSGSYRGPATFSSETLATARQVRQQILRFLINGQGWINNQQQHKETSTVWNDNDHQLYSTCQQARRLSLEALRNDMNGTEFLEQCLRIVRAGNEYISQRNDDIPAAVEPMTIVLSTLRNLLALVGFTHQTVQAGFQKSPFSTTESTSTQVVIGGEQALLEALVQFRSTIRQIALEESKTGTVTKDSLQRILKSCDRLRDDELPQLGIQLLDSKVDGGQDDWTICLPKQPTDIDATDVQEVSHPGQSTPVDLTTTPLLDLFRQGPYEGQFSAYNDEGIPTHNADGTELSKRARSKLLKKYEAHKARLAKGT